MVHLPEDEPAALSSAARFINGALADHDQFACSDTSLRERAWRLAGGRGTFCNGHRFKSSSFGSLFPDCRDGSHILPLIQLQPSLFFNALFLCWHPPRMSLCATLAKPADIGKERLWLKRNEGLILMDAFFGVCGSLKASFTINTTLFYRDEGDLGVGVRAPWVWSFFRKMDQDVLGCFFCFFLIFR